jgi:hypothetical protein
MTVTETIITATTPGIEGIGIENSDRIPVHVAMTAITTIGIGMREDVQKIGIEIEMIATAMISLTDVGPGMTIMTTREAVNDVGSMMIENGLGLLTIDTARNHLMSRTFQSSGIPSYLMMLTAGIHHRC